MLNFFRLHRLREIATPILLRIFHTRWAEYMRIEQQNVGTSSAGSQQWMDGRECGEKVAKTCKANGVPLIGVMAKEMRDGNSSQWDVTMLTAAIQAVTKAIQKGKHFD